jgi:uncharacterized protein DUF1707
LRSGGPDADQEEGIATGLRKRREEADEQVAIELREKHAAHGLLQAALRDGDLDEREYLRRRDRVYQAVTPRDLWKATGGRAGSKRRSDWKAIRKAVLLQVWIIIFAALAMLLILWGTIIYFHPSRA